MATPIVTLDDGAAGQYVTVLVCDNNTMFVHGQGLALRGQVNYGASVGDAITLVNVGGIWREVSRAEA